MLLRTKKKNADMAIPKDGLKKRDDNDGKKKNGEFFFFFVPQSTRKTKRGSFPIQMPYSPDQPAQATSITITMGTGDTTTNM